MRFHFIRGLSKIDYVSVSVFAFPLFRFSSCCCCVLVYIFFFFILCLVSYYIILFLISIFCLYEMRATVNKFQLILNVFLFFWMRVILWHSHYTLLSVRAKNGNIHSSKYLLELHFWWYNCNCNQNHYVEIIEILVSISSNQMRQEVVCR